MKKLFTLLFTFGSLTSVFAQYNNDNRTSRSDRNDKNSSYETRDNNGKFSKPAQGPELYGKNNDKRDYATNDRRYNDAYSMNSRERDFRISKINREYDYKIGSISSNRYLRPREKNFQIQRLQKQKFDEIRYVHDLYSDSRNRFNDGHSNRW